MVRACQNGFAEIEKEMDDLYQCKDRVSYSRIDTEGKLKVHAIVNAM